MYELVRLMRAQCRCQETLVSIDNKVGCCTRCGKRPLLLASYGIEDFYYDMTPLRGQTRMVKVWPI